MDELAVMLTDREKNQAACRRLYRRRRDAGLCGRCGAPAIAGKSQCSTCCAAALEYKRERYHLLVANKLCVVCADDATDGVWCARHAALKRARSVVR